MTPAEMLLEVPLQTKPDRKRRYNYLDGPPPVYINMAWCKACNICSALCPKEVLDTDLDGRPVVAHAENCTQCGICWTHCPDAAIASNYR